MMGGEDAWRRDNDRRAREAKQVIRVTVAAEHVEEIGDLIASMLSLHSVKGTVQYSTLTGDSDG